KNMYKRHQIGIWVVGGVLVVTSLLVLCGWQTDNDTLKRIVPGFVAMNPVTALSFLAIGVALIALLQERLRPLVLVLGGIVVVIGVLKLAEVMGLPLAIDQWLFYEKLNAENLPNRMAPNTAFNFVLVGSMVILLAKARWLKVLRVIATLSILLSTAAVLGYVYGLQRLYGVAGFIPMALHTATLFMLVSIVCVWLTVRPDVFRTVGRRIVVGLFVLVIIGAGLAWFIINGLRTSQEVQEEVQQARQTVMAVEGVIRYAGDAETKQREYLLTGSTDALAAYNAIIPRKHEAIGVLRDLVASDPAQSARVKNLEQDLEVRLGALDEGVKAYQRAGLAAAQEVISSGYGIRAMAQARSHADEIETAANAHLDTSLATQKSQGRQLFGVMVLGSAVSIGIIASIYGFLLRENQRRNRAEAALRSEVATQKRLEHTLKENNERFELVAKATNDVLYDLDIKRNTVWWSDELYNSYGHKPGKEKTSFEWWVDHIHPDDAMAINESLEALVTNKQNTWIHEYRFQMANGEYMYVRDRAFVLRDAKANPVRLIGSLLDITKQKELDRAKDEFISLVSHQLRTPLTAIRLFVEMLIKGQAGKLAKAQQDYIEKVDLSTRRMIRLVGDILNVSRIELGRIKVTPADFDPNAMIQSRIDEIEPLANEKGTKIVFTPTPLPLIPLDDNVFGQVIHNLLTNAIRYTPSSGGRVDVAFEKKTDGYVLSVKDNGIGIPPEAKAHIFERFYRADNAVRAVGDGTGLGLYLIKMIITTVGGKVWFESNPGQGTVFYVFIPKEGMKAKEGERKLE
ncbi:MAG TPA: ATP-binding protein, partial [Candidatus Saccharimonadales bacterium]|nr:ATP-binding protein [Candidatus Saccharimonadales bacterium]